MSNKEEYYNNPDDSKKERKGVRIAGFYITYKTMVIIGVIVLIIVGYSQVKSCQRKAEIAERNRIAEEQAAAKNSESNTPAVVDYEAKIQANLVKKYGEPPEGFEWDTLGNLVSLTNDDSMSYEDVAYAFIRSCSILDFSTAGKYSLESYTIETFQDYFQGVVAVTDYYENFLRKQYKFALTTLEVNSVNDIAIMADGTAILSINVSCLDLQDKDFWKVDQEKIFDELYYYDITEDDMTKANDYLYDYIYKAYEDGTVGKRSYDIDLVVSKNNGSGWYVSDDSELRDSLLYENGKDVAAYIKDLYKDYKIDRGISEKTGEDWEYEELENHSDDLDFED